MSDSDNLDDLLSQLKNNDKQSKQYIRAVDPPPAGKEEIEKFIVKNSTILITQSVSTLQDLRDQVSAAPDPDNIAAYSELVRASSTAIENLNKIVLMDKRNETTLSAKRMDINARSQSDDKKIAAGLIAASRDEILEKLVQDADVIDVTPETPKLSG